MEFLAIATGELLLLLGAGIASYMMLRRVARRISKSSVPAPPRSAAKKTDVPPSRTHHELTASSDRAVIDLYELARDLQGELDSKARVLQFLIAEARAEAERLEKLLAQTAALSRVPDVADEDELLHMVHQAAASPYGAPAALIPPYAETINRLANAGETPVAIAERLGRPLGEVEMVLSLRT